MIFSPLNQNSIQTFFVKFGLAPQPEKEEGELTRVALASSIWEEGRGVLLIVRLAHMF
jgi:hypothetical protein